MRTYLDRLFNALDGLLVFVASVAMVLMALHVATDILSRLVLSESLDATTEIVSHYYMVSIGFLPLLHLRRKDLMIKVEILSGLMSARSIRVSDIATDLLLASWFLVWAWYTAEHAIHKTQIGEFVDTTVDMLVIWPSRWLLPVGMTLVGIYCLLMAWRRLVGHAVTDGTRKAVGEDVTA
ncbi:MAG: hypothetical protein A3G25_05875 [Betaproteobacteria bacterium RIFCSPLOWO2_12_FULL_63_13]|nr:MAG: hypothetical protein A3G25_05875 [Betaproteobacteria bacterium RIFCSPLOWO2_12_FULL_63_13]